jgi:hypothetical protein
MHPCPRAHFFMGQAEDEPASLQLSGVKPDCVTAVERTSRTLLSIGRDT